LVAIRQVRVVQVQDVVEAPGAVLLVQLVAVLQEQVQAHLAEGQEKEAHHAVDAEALSSVSSLSLITSSSRFVV
jgi:hypothetical protein